MAEPLNVYRDWLSIKNPQPPLDHYTLLRLKKFEDDPAKVRQHYRKLNAHVRKYAAGDYAKESQALLNELAKAMLCLTDTRRKLEYDASLGRDEKGGDRKYTFEQILVGRKIIDTDQLKKARDYADAIGLEVRDALVQQKFASQDVVIQSYAESLGLPFVDVGELRLDTTLIGKVPAVLARQHSCAPIMVDDGQVLMASPNPLNPEVEDELRLRFEMPVRSVLCTPAGINQVVAEHYPREAAAAEIAAGSDQASLAANPSGTQAAEAAIEMTPEAIAERKKERRNITLLSFNFAMIISFGVTQYLGLSYLVGMTYALPLAAMVGGTVFMLKK